MNLLADWYHKRPRCVKCGSRFKSECLDHGWCQRCLGAIQQQLLALAGKIIVYRAMGNTSYTALWILATAYFKSIKETQQAGILASLLWLARNIDIPDHLRIKKDGDDNETAELFLASIGKVSGDETQLIAEQIAGEFVIVKEFVR